MDVKEVREILERGLDKDRHQKFSDAMECMTTHRWYWRWAQDLESNCKDALAALSSIDPDAIRAEALREERGRCEDIVCALWPNKDAIRFAILSGEPTHGDKDYPEDALHENGNYECICSTCGSHFTGHKRRVLCKACDAILTDEPKERDAEEAEIDFVEPTNRDMQIADEVRMCKLGIGAAIRVAKYRIEVERKIKEAEE